MDFKISKEKKLRFLNDFKSDFAAAQNSRTKIIEKMSYWKKLYNGEPYGNEDKSGKRSKIVSRDIKKQSEWQHAELLDPFISTPNIVRCIPVTSEDVLIAPRVETLLNTQFCRQFNRFNFMSKALRVLDIEGTCVIKTGWEFEEKTIKEQVFEEKPNPEYEQLMIIMQQAQASGDSETLSKLQQIANSIPPTIKEAKIVSVTKPVINRPTAIVCRNEDIFIDPTCLDDMDKCNFIIYRYESDLHSLKKSGLYENLDRINIDNNSNFNEPNFRSYDSSFEFSDRARKKLVVYEYWGYYDINDDDILEPIVATWVGDTLIRLDENPFPDKKIPFIVVPFNPIPFQMYGESNAELLDDIQKFKTAIMRGVMDNMALSNNAQKGIRKGALDVVNKKKFLAGENFEFNGSSNDFYDGNFNEMPSLVFNLLSFLSNEAESITGVKSFSQGMTGNSLGSTATSVRGTLNSAAQRRLNIVKNIAENLIKPLLRKWLAYDAEFLDEETQIRITNDEFLWIKRDDLGANIDLEFAISTTDDNQNRAQELSFMLQTNAQTLPFEITKPMLVQLARLYRLPDLAKSIEEYEPQPDPIAEQLQQIQLQGAQAEVELTSSKAQKNMAEIPLKEAKVETELAKAENMGSRTDMQDLDFLRKYNQIDEKNSMAEQNRKNQFDLDLQALKLLGSTKGRYL